MPTPNQIEAKRRLLEIAEDKKSGANEDGKLIISLVISAIGMAVPPSGIVGKLALLAISYDEKRYIQKLEAVVEGKTDVLPREPGTPDAGLYVG
jgi:hypothetical protein